eukprot:TRINITY_DN55211_c0_g1_i1.p1 TRINITY_DN55211_c0_g1~~TRINITY_DN55211_c0_g1_i1.p1  ORF type:complete len:248 (+),score=43.55 TRINITY_DN55211_c0_g1_i1:83-826(+)
MEELERMRVCVCVLLRTRFLCHRVQRKVDGKNCTEATENYFEMDVDASGTWAWANENIQNLYLARYPSNTSYACFSNDDDIVVGRSLSLISTADKKKAILVSFVKNVKLCLKYSGVYAKDVEVVEKEHLTFADVDEGEACLVFRREKTGRTDDSDYGVDDFALYTKLKEEEGYDKLYVDSDGSREIVEERKKHWRENYIQPLRLTKDTGEYEKKLFITFGPSDWKLDDSLTLVRCDTCRCQMVSDEE